MDERGTVQDLVPTADCDPASVEKIEGILSPGFINCHCHTELSHMRGMIPMHTGLVAFVSAVMQHRFDGGHHADTAIEAALRQMHEEGIVAVGDICNTIGSIAVKRDSPLFFRNFVEVSGFVPATAAQRLEAGKKVREAFAEALPHFPATIVPHAPYSVSEALLAQIAQISKGEIISIHNQETAAEDELFTTGTGDFLNLYKGLGIDLSFFEPPGKNALAAWAPHFAGQQCIAVHNTFTRSAHLAALRAQGKQPDLFFCLCPNANLYIENTLPHWRELEASGFPIVLGTDSLASNQQLSIIAEINTLLRHFSELTLETCLQWATLQGARALGIADNFGSFEKGKQPGVVQIKKGPVYEARRVQ